MKEVGSVQNWERHAPWGRRHTLASEGASRCRAIVERHGQRSAGAGTEEDLPQPKSDSNISKREQYSASKEGGQGKRRYVCC